MKMTQPKISSAPNPSAKDAPQFLHAKSVSPTGAPHRGHSPEVVMMQA